MLFFLWEVSLCVNNYFLTICNTFLYYYDYTHSTVSSNLSSGLNSSLKHFHLLMLIRGYDGSEFLKSESQNTSYQYFIFVSSFIFINFVSPKQLMSLEQGPWKDLYLPWISGYSSVKWSWLYLYHRAVVSNMTSRVSLAHNKHSSMLVHVFVHYL